MRFVLLRRLFGKKEPTRVFVIGLDCAPPELLFEQWRHELPNLGKLMDGGAYGNLKSATPAITVPAWSSMTSSKDPGTLGFYGFRNRKDYTYDGRYIATGLAVKEKRIWDILGEHDKKSIVVGLPQTYPVKPINGHLISSFLTPDTVNPKIKWTYPASLRPEIEQLLAPETYDVDVREFRTDDKAHILQQINDMTRKRFKVMRYLLDEKEWDFFMFVEMGVDRIHHALWAYHDPTHPKHDPDSPYVNAIRDYYHYLDGEIGSLLQKLPENTHVMVVSDHGVKKMHGGICINEWLRREGYLVLKSDPPAGTLTTFDKLEVDWEKTTVWGDGGYYARIFFNIEGREPQGAIPVGELDEFKRKFIDHLKSLPDPQGNPIGTVVFQPHDIYHEVRNVPPDLLVYLGNLEWRSVGSLGHDDIYTFENDTGPDDANHAENGIYIYTPPKADLAGKRLPDAQLMDFAPTVLNLFDLPIPGDMQGNVIPHA